jgi:3',5'-cyclic AMP phosphodiesterase CpdA
MKPQPDFVVFTGDLTHTTDDPQERSKRMTEFRDIVSKLNVKNVYFLPGEHDASLDNGAAFKEIFGKTYYTFDNKGVHFIAIDNVSDPTASIGDAQLQWLSDDLKKLDKNSTIVVLTHRPLFDLYPQWDWATRDASKAIDLLAPFKHVTVFYGHIHQVNEHTAGNITQYAAKGTMYPLPAPGSVAKKTPIPWDSAEPYKGLGFRKVEINPKTAVDTLTEYTIDQMKQVISITAKKFEFIPKEITIKKGVPVILELTSLDRLHGFNCPDLKARTDVNPGKISRVQITPEKEGTFEFNCDVFCGDGHEGMTGNIIVKK